MKLVYSKIHEWPKLAWVAKIANRSENILVYHGPMVETKDDWCAEAVWAGEFTEGHFDRTDLIFGTGIRCRSDKVTFVSSGTMMDRLWYCHYDGFWYVSNSLPAILASAGFSLREDYQSYTQDINQMIKGLKASVQSIPTNLGDVFAIYYDNLIYQGRGVHKINKPDSTPKFPKFGDYYGFMIETARRLASNYSSSDRTYRIYPLCTISSGYDSPAASIIASHAGCKKAVTIKNANSLWRGSDSGFHIAKQIGMDCLSYGLIPKTIVHEDAIWAAAGRPGELNWTQFDYPHPLCLFFTAFHGDTVWDRSNRDLSDPLVRPSITGLGFCEFRLLKGVFHCAIPFWGIKRAKDIQSISFSREMETWSLASGYDRPIARRIIEESGIPRGAFATIKKNTSGETQFVWPHSFEARASFATYLKERDLFVPGTLLIWLLRRIAKIDHLIGANVTQRMGFDIRLRHRIKIKANFLLFQWANSEMKKRYEKGLKS